MIEREILNTTGENVEIGVVTYADMEKLTTFNTCDLYDRDGLKGIEYMPNLKSLNINFYEKYYDDYKVLFKSCINLENLIITKKDDDTIPEGLLENCKKLKRIVLRGFNEDDMEGLLDSCTALEYLDLKEASIEVIPEGMLDNNRELRYILFDYSKAQELPKGLLANCEKLLCFTMMESNIKQLDETIFSNCRELEIVAFCDSRLESLPEGLFDNCVNLKEVNFEDTFINEIPKGLFDSCVNLEEVFFSAFAFNSIPKEIFRNCKKIKRLKLGDDQSRIKQIPEDLLASCKELEDLELGNMPKNSKLPSKLLKGQSKLKKINLHINSVEEISESFFEDCIGLEEVVLPGTECRMSNRLFENCKKIEYIYIPYQNLRYIPDEWFEKYKIILSH